MFEGLDKRWLLIPLGVLLAVSSLIFFFSQSSRVGHEQMLAQVLQDTQLNEFQAGLRWNSTAPERPEKIEVYVDLSETMRPYLMAPTSTYRDLLTGLYNQFSGEAVFKGFGFPDKESDQREDTVSLPDLLTPDTYNFINNSYAVLFRRFNTDVGVRLVITDGVQSDPNTNALFGDIREGIAGWLEAGGAFAVLLYRTPYAGRYFSMARTPDLPVAYTCKDRPLVVFAFAASVRQLDYMMRLLGDELQPQEMIRLGGGPSLESGATLEVTLAEYGLPSQQQQRRTNQQQRGPRLFRNPRTSFLLGYDSVQTVQLLRETQDENGFVPLQFDIRLDRTKWPWSSTDEQSVQDFMLRLQPELQAWRVDTPSDSTVTLEPVALNGRKGMITVSADSSQHLNARLVLPIEMPAARQHTAWVLTLRPDPVSASWLIPDDYTTPDDTDPAACSRVLNLEPLLRRILQDHYIPARRFFLTEWR
jgi:hypothetical protein